MNRPVRPIVLLIPLATLLIVVLILWAGYGRFGLVRTTPTQTASGLQGTDLGNTQAPDFHLVDHHGKPVALTQFKGMPVVVTFFYTHCPDFCPLAATKIHSSLVGLGEEAQHVAILAVSVDPQHDTPASALSFSQAHELEGYANYHYLLGSRPALTPVWQSYAVEGISATAQVEDMKTMGHTSVLYLIDHQGRERVLLNSDFTPSQLTANLKVLLQKQ
jgi:protein SCO1